MPRKLQWAEAFFCAAHVSDSGVMHGHTWTVRAWWADDGKCIEQQGQRLRTALAPFDHATLPDALRRSEDMAEHLGLQLGAVRVEVVREREGLHGHWFAE